MIYMLLWSPGRGTRKKEELSFHDTGIPWHSHPMTVIPWHCHTMTLLSHDSSHNSIIPWHCHPMTVMTLISRHSYLDTIITWNCHTMTLIPWHSSMILSSITLIHDAVIPWHYQHMKLSYHDTVIPWGCHLMTLTPWRWSLYIQTHPDVSGKWTRSSAVSQDITECKNLQHTQKTTFI